MRRRGPGRGSRALALRLLAWGAAAAAQFVLAQAARADDVVIPGDLGTLRGENLFHEFETFDVELGGSATFTRGTLTEPIDRVIGRVTGGRQSRIDGRLASTIDGADLFLVNPAGVFFGPQARLDVLGSFYASTADDVRFGPAAVAALAAESGGLLAAPDPVEFGFLQATPAGISVDGSVLRVPRGESLSLIGGAIGVRGGPDGFLSAEEGALRLVSVASSGVVLDPGTGASLELSGFEGLGEISITDDAILTTGIPPDAVAGNVFANPPQRVSDLQRGSPIPLVSFPLVDELQPGDVLLAPFRDGFSVIRPLPRGESGGRIEVKARDLEIVDSDLRTVTLGDGGEIDVELTGDLEIRQVERDVSVGLLAAAGGAFPIEGGNLIVPGPGFVTVDDFTLFAGGESPGRISVRARDVRLEGGAKISASSNGLGPGGEIALEASGNVELSGFDREGNPTGVFANAQGLERGGDVRVQADALRLTDGGGLFAQTTRDAKGGGISVEVRRLEILGPSQIDSSTSGQSIPEDAPEDVTTSGEGGNVEVVASGSALLSGRVDEDNFARISAFSQARSRGKGGSIRVETPLLEILDGGGISARSEGPGDAGEVVLDVGRLVVEDGAEVSARSTGEGLAGGIDIRAKRVEVRRGAIETEAAISDGGDIGIRATELVYVLGPGGKISTSVAGGTGGRIDIDPDFVVLNNGAIIAQAGAGVGGSIDIVSRFFLSTPGSLVSASSEQGIDGTVVVRAPDTDLAAGLTPLPETYLEAEELFADRCAERAGRRPGSLVIAGYEGLPDTPNQLRSARHRIDVPLDSAAARAAASAERSGDREAAIAGWAAAAREETSPAGRGAALLRLAQAYEATGAYSRGLEASERALDAATPSGDRSAVAAVRGVAARLLARTGFVERGLSELDQTLADAPTDDSALLARLHLDRGHLLMRLERTDAARESYRRAAQGKGPLVSALASAALGRIALRTGDLVEARAAFDDAAATLRPADASQDAVFALLHVADGLEELIDAGADGPDALRFDAGAIYVRAASAARELDDARGTSWALGGLGGLYEREGRGTEALELSRLALLLAQRRHAPEALYRWHWQIGRIERRLGSIDGAIASLRSAVEVLGALRRNAVLRDAQQAAFARSFPVEPVTTALVDALLQRAAQTEDPNARVADLRVARDRLEDLGAVELRDFFEDECVASQRRAAPDTLPGAVVIYPVILPGRTELLVSLPDGMKSLLVEVGAEELHAEVRAFRRLLQQRDQRYLRPAERLYDWLVRPVERELDGVDVDVMVFVPRGPLRGVPMAALRNSRTREFLIERYPLAVAPGLSLTEPKAIEIGEAPLLKGGLTEGVQGYPPLHYVADELDRLDTLLGGKTLLDTSFRAEALEKELASRSYGIVHLASHAEFGGGADDAFLLTYDGRLSLKELTELVGRTEFREQPLELLTLSACETAVGDDRAALGLAGVAVEAGARSTVATLWFVDDEATSVLMGEFYRHLAQPGTSRALALQRAQVALLAERDWRHPAYWSPFLLIGSWL
jgi:filamentous hemagglutinin family protein